MKVLVLHFPKVVNCSGTLRTFPSVLARWIAALHGCAIRGISMIFNHTDGVIRAIITPSESELETSERVKRVCPTFNTAR